MTASELVCRQAGLNPQGAIGTTETFCLMCGRIIHSGEHRSTFRPSSSFMDSPELCARDKSTQVCGYCVHLTNKSLMLKTQLVCVTQEHVIPAAKLVHKKWLLLNPPEPPFVFLQTDAKLAHMIWRTPITVSQDMWYVRLGGRQLTVRLRLVRKALERFKGIAERFEAAKHPKQPLRHPFSTLDFELRDLHAWRIRGDVASFLDAHDSDLILALKPGEYWALAILTSKQKPEKPEKKLNAGI
jgi:CRISPR type IV-associated protein Csf1